MRSDNSEALSLDHFTKLVEKMAYQRKENRQMSFRGEVKQACEDIYRKTTIIEERKFKRLES